MYLILTVDSDPVPRRQCNSESCYKMYTLYVLIFFLPHMSTAYNSVRTICASESLKNITGELQPILFSTHKISIVPFCCDYHVCHCFSKLCPVDENKSQKVLTTSNFWSSQHHLSLAPRQPPPFLNTITFDFSKYKRIRTNLFATKDSAFN